MLFSVCKGPESPKTPDPGGPSVMYSTQTPCIQSIDDIFVVTGISALQPRGRQVPGPASIPVLLSGAGASTPQRQEALPTEAMERVGGKNEESCNSGEKRR